jgi:hypothetical protein
VAFEQIQEHDGPPARANHFQSCLALTDPDLFLTSCQLCSLLPSIVL